MFRKASIAFVAAVAAAAVGAGCATKESKAVGCVIENTNLQGVGDTIIVFGTGELADGYAVLLVQANAAYWVNEGQAYVVNEEAKQLSPSLSGAPDNVTYDAVYAAVDAHPGDPGME